MEIDISVIISAPNKSVDVAVEYCRKRNLIIEVLDDQMLAKGKYVFVADTFVFYEDYALHYMWVCLDIKDRECDRFRATQCTVYEPVEEEFYNGYAHNGLNFYRRAHEKNKSKYYIESKVFLFATLFKVQESERLLPSDSVLVKYHKYFSELLLND